MPKSEHPHFSIFSPNHSALKYGLHSKSLQSSYFYQLFNYFYFLCKCIPQPNHPNYSRMNFSYREVQVNCHYIYTSLSTIVREFGFLQRTCLYRVEKVFVCGSGIPYPICPHKDGKIWNLCPCGKFVGPHEKKTAYKPGVGNLWHAGG